MDFSRIGTGHRIAAGAGLLLLIDLWLNWYKIDEAITAGVDVSYSAWESFALTDFLLALLALAAIAAALQHLGMLRLPVRLSSILFPAAAVLTLWVLFRIISVPEVVENPAGNDSFDVSFGAIVGLLLLALITYGAMKAQGEHENVGDADFNTDAVTGGGTTTTTAPPPPPAAPTTPPPSDPPPPPPATG